MRTWDRLSATFVKGVRRAGKFDDGGGLYLQATATRARAASHQVWLLRYQIERRERYMGLGSARVLSLAEARARANEARSRWRAASIRSARGMPSATPPA